MTQHTPTPWHTVRYRRPDGPVHIKAENGRYVSEHLRGDDSGEANAEFIVRACNAHDALVTALQEINEKAFQALGHTPDGLVTKLVQAILETCDIALAKALPTEIEP